MKKFTVKLVTYYPATEIEELIEIEAPNAQAAAEYAVNGDGYLLSETIEYGEASSEEVLEVTSL